MILSGREILKHIGKDIIIEPFDKKRINPNSICDLFLKERGKTNESRPVKLLK